MTTPLYQELVAQGFSPTLNFTNDGYTKILHIENTGEDVRISEHGNIVVPSIDLATQNPTLKTISGGVRVHLAEAPPPDL